ncbi:MAG TPA: PAS domain S-box protein [Cyclobacteriaceae bacterium]|nr:PAS domain S-box protein [Cyclobacteriaceae bacterium]
MEARNVNILLVESNPGDAFYIKELLELPNTGMGNVFTAHSLQEALEQVDRSFSAALLDLDLTDSKGLSTFEVFLERFPEVPIIVLAEPHQAALGLSTVKRGAQDCLILGEFDEQILKDTIVFGVERSGVDKELRRTTHRYRTLFDRNPLPMLIYAIDSGKMLRVNKAAEIQYGYSKEEFEQIGLEALADTAHLNTTNGSLNRVEQHRRKDNTFFSAEVIEQDVEYDGVAARQLIITDITSREATRQALLNSEYNLRQAQEIADIGYWVMNLRTRSVQWSEHMTRIVRGAYPTGELTGSQFLDVIHPEDRPEATRMVRRILKEHQPVDLDIRAVRPDGEVRWLHAKAELLLEQGEPVVRGVVQDITTRKNAEVQLKATQKFSRVLLENISDAVTIISSAGKLIYANGATSRITGRPIAHMGGHEFIHWIHPEDRRAVVSRYAKLSSGVSSTYEARILHHDGTYRWIEGVVTNLVQDEDIGGYLTSARDISAKKEFENRITAIARELTDLIEHANAAIFGIDRNGYINEWNRVTEEVSGARKSQVLGTRLIDLIDPSPVKEATRLVLDKVLSGHMEDNFEFPIRTGSTERALLLNATPRRSDSGDIVGVLFVGQDITELTAYRSDLENKVRERTTELELALDRQRELLEVKNKFVSMVSHEFRTPLATIGIATDFMVKYHERLTAEKLKEKASTIERQVAHMTHLLDDILTIGRGDAGKIAVNPSDIKPDFFIDLANEVERSTGSSHLIVKEMKIRAAKIRLDQKLLRNIIINLLTNAIKFSPDSESIHYGVSADKKMLVIEVADTGIGIEPGHRSELFTAFHRGANAGTIPGTGLGLSIVKKATQLLNGTISVESEPGKGTRFVVRVPLIYGA